LNHAYLVIAPSLEGKFPDAATDEIVAAFYSYQLSEGETPQNGTLVVEDSRFHQRRRSNSTVQGVTTELDLINTFTDIVVDLDPDIIVGWELERGSWGYLATRAHQYGIPLFFWICCS
jgi:DNA polymerase zeta